MINVIKSLIFALFGMSSLGWLSILLIITLSVGPSPDDFLLSFIESNLINSEVVDQLGLTFTNLANQTYDYIALLNIFLLIVTIIFCICWSIASHFLNIDAPGKAKIYFIHWFIFSGIFVASLFGITFFFVLTSSFGAAQYLSRTGITILFVVPIIFYFIVYYLGVLLGTARFARSSVLFANKLPGNL
jgi:hypothetical protein